MTGTPLTPAGVLRALAADVDAHPDRWPGRDQYAPGVDVDGDFDGYRDDEWLYVRAAAWARITGRPGADVLAVLRDRGALDCLDGRWQVLAPRWTIQRPRVYRLRLASLADPPPDPDPASITAPAPVASPQAGRFTGWPWEAPEPRPPATEPCPDCGAPAARTPQGTLTDCPSCGLVLTAGCRDRMTAGETARTRPGPSTAAPEPPTLAEQFAGMLADAQVRRERTLVAGIYREWAEVMEPEGLPDEMAGRCGPLHDAFTAAAELAGRAASMPELARIRTAIGAPLLDAAYRLESLALDARGQEPDDDGGEWDDEPDDGRQAPERIEPGPASPVPGRQAGPPPACGRCHRGALAVARVDTAEPGHRAALGAILPADVCAPCLDELRAITARHTYVTLVVTGTYPTEAQFRQLLAEFRPVAPLGISGPRRAPVRAPGRVINPSRIIPPGRNPQAAPPAPAPRLAPFAPARTASWAGADPMAGLTPPAPAVAAPKPIGATVREYRRQKRLLARCEIRAGHRRSVILGNAMPVAAIRVTGTGQDGARVILACGDKCAQRAAAVLAANGHNEIMTEQIR